VLFVFGEIVGYHRKVEVRENVDVSYADKIVNVFVLANTAVVDC